MKTLICFGTRPEAIKMAPICFELSKQKISYKLCVTAQHREILDLEVTLRAFDNTNGDGNVSKRIVYFLKAL